MRKNMFFTGITILAFILTACGRAAVILPTATSAPTAVPPTQTLAPTDTVQQPSPTVEPKGPQSSVSSPDIFSLQMIDTSNGWALGASGLLKTTDGGITWNDTSPLGLTPGVSMTFFLDAQHAWVGLPGSDPSTSGTLYLTSDGGSTWTSASVPFGNASLSFADPNTGWAMVGLGAGMSHMAVAIFRTTDSGQTWTQVFTDDPNAANTSDSLPFVGDKNGITALDASHAWVTGAEPMSDYNYVFYSNNGGASWVEQNPALPAALAGAMTNINPPYFFNGSRAVLPVVASASTSSTVLYTTNDGGQSWFPTTPVPLVGRVSTPDANTFFVWDGGKTLYASQSGGADWKTVTTNVDLAMDLVSFQFVDASTGWLLTSDASGHHTLYKTTDGGVTWTAILP